MAVTSSSAKVKFFVGDFNLSTESLVLPASSQNNTLTLEIEELISPQLSGWGDTPLDIFALLSVDFEGENAYKNAEFDSPSTVSPPSNPEITITPNANPATTESVVINTYVPLVTGDDGKIVSGNYTITAKFVYWAFDTAYGFEEGTFTTDFQFTENTPSVTTPYNPGTPKLTITDGQTYQINGTTADRDTEFVLYPPENLTPIVNTFDNIQKVSYNSFFTGGNELKYTILLTYTFTDQIIVNAQQVYRPFTIFYVDECSIYSCLNNQYQILENTTCGAGDRVAAQETYWTATGIGFQIINGLGCAEDDLSGLIEGFNKLLDCDCNCLDSTPRQIGATSVIPVAERQSVTTDGALLTVDLSLGSTVSVNVLENITIAVSNIEQFNNYRFLFTTTSTDKQVTFSFSQFRGGTGPIIASKTVTADEILLTDFYSELQTELTLVSSND